MSRRTTCRRPSDQSAGVPEREDLSILARAVTPLVLAEIARLAASAATPATYSSRRGEGPPGYPHRAWQSLAKRIGTRRGRWFIVTAAALAAHERGEAETAVAENDAEPWSPRAAFASVGLRGSR